MEYTIKQLAELSGVTPRTLRWYDRLGLLRPGRLTAYYDREISGCAAFLQAAVLGWLKL